MAAYANPNISQAYIFMRNNFSTGSTRVASPRSVLIYRKEELSYIKNRTQFVSVSCFFSLFKDSYSLI